MRTRTPQKLVYVALQEASKKRKKGCTKGSRFCFLLKALWAKGSRCVAPGGLGVERPRATPLGQAGVRRQYRRECLALVRKHLALCRFRARAFETCVLGRLFALEADSHVRPLRQELHV